MPAPTTTWRSRSISTSCSLAFARCCAEPAPRKTRSTSRCDPTSRRVWRGQREVELSKTEFDLLELLVRNQGIVLEHSTIYDRIWGYDFGPDSKNLAVYISYLRRKLEGEGDSKIIHTVRGVGYTVRSS